MCRLLCLIGALLTCASAWAEVAASVVFFSGQPTLTASDGQVRRLARGEEVRGGDTIDTVDGRVQLRFRDGASISLQPGSRFRVDRFQFSGPAAAAGDGVVMTLVKGALRTVTGLLGKRDPAQYKMGTTVATIGIRGTEYGAELDGSGLWVRTYAGLVEVCSRVGCVEVKAGDEVWVRGPDEKPELRPGGGLRGSAPATPDIPVRIETALPQGGGAQRNDAGPPVTTPTHSPNYPANW